MTAGPARKPWVLVHAPRAVERIAVATVLAGTQRFAVAFGVGQPPGRARSAPDVLVWVGGPYRSAGQPHGAAQIPRVMVLREVSSSAAVMALRQGAAGLACMSCHLEQLPKTVDAILTGQGWLSPCLARAVADHLAGRARLQESERCGLTVRELSVLRPLAAGAGNDEIAEGLGIDIRTVKFHVSNIYRKLGARHRAEAVAIAYRLGLAG
jgi:DNA-binding CsgD family transcriptional regulator